MIIRTNESGGTAFPMSPIERSAGRFMRAPDHEGGAGGSAGDGTAVSAVFGGGGGGDTVSAGAGADTVQAGGGSDTVDGGAIWADALSADAQGDTPSNRDWVKAKGFKDADALASSYREAERALRVGGKIEVPKEGATSEQIEAFHKAIGRPEKPDDYVVKLPDGVQGEIDERLVGSYRDAAFKAGLPAGMAQSLGDWYIEQQLDQDRKVVADRNRETQELFGEWGQQKDPNLAMCNRAAAKLGLDAGAIADIQKGFGAKNTLNLMLKLGQGLAEDAMLDGGGRQKFGVTGAEARAQLNTLLADPEFGRKVMAKDPVTIARKERLEAAIAAEMDREQRAG